MKKREEADSFFKPHHLAMPGVDTVTTYSIKLYIEHSLPLLVENDMSGFKKFKKLVKTKNIPKKCK